MNSTNLHQAIYTRLAGYTALTSKVVGIYSQVPQPDDAQLDSAFPYVTLGPYFHTPFDTDDDDGQRVAAQIHIWDRSTTELTRAAIQDAIYDALHKFDLVISGANTIDCLFESAVKMYDPDGKTSHSVLTFRITYNGI